MGFLKRINIKSYKFQTSTLKSSNFCFQKFKLSFSKIQNSANIQFLKVQKTKQKKFESLAFSNLQI